MSSFQQQLLDLVPASIKRVLESSSRKELNNSINASLIIFNDALLHVESGKVCKLENGDESNGIAIATKQLLSEVSEDMAILLLLPPAAFVATTHSLPGISKDNIVSALRLQTESILPSYAENLSLALDASINDVDSETIALWLPQAKLDELFSAFAAENLFLAAVKPRILHCDVNEASAGHTGLLDEDETDVTFVTFAEGVLNSWQQANKLDFEQEEYLEQWNSSINVPGVDSHKAFSQQEDYLSCSNNLSNSEFNFYPDGALNARKKVEKGRRAFLGLAVVAILLFLSAIPFLQQSYEFRSASADLDSNRAMSAEARQDQQTVVNFENEWGPLSDFPEQRIREAMFTLQNVLSPERLSSLEVSEGLIKIQGTSTDPQAILQRLEQDPLFTEVVFSRATNNTRYYIDLRLSPVNFEAYLVRYFPDS